MSLLAATTSKLRNDAGKCGYGPRNPCERYLPPLLMLPEQPKKPCAWLCKLDSWDFLLAISTQSEPDDFFGEWPHFLTPNPLPARPQGMSHPPQIWQLEVTLLVKHTASSKPLHCNYQDTLLPNFKALHRSWKAPKSLQVAATHKAGFCVFHPEDQDLS